MKKNLLPIHILLLFLIFLTIWSTVFWNGTDITSWILSLKNFVLLGLAGLCVRFGIRYLIDDSYKPRLEHRLITTLILFLLFDALTPWWIFITLGVVTELIQYFFRSPLGPIVNPAAAGALVLSLFGYLPLWWGVNPPPRFPLFGIEISVIAWITALGAGYVVHRYRKLPIAVATLLGFIISYVLFFQQNPSYFILEGTLLFFILVMVCEPKTSPVPRTEQILYGTLVGSLVPLGLYFHFLEASLIALLIGNLYVSRRFFLKALSSFNKPPESVIPTS